MSKNAVLTMISGAVAPCYSNVFVNNASEACTLQITGTFTTATVLVEGIVNLDANRWETLATFNLSSLILKTQGMKKDGIYGTSIAGILRVRIHVTAVSGGDITVAANFVGATMDSSAERVPSSLAPITAYDMAVAGGYSGTLQQFETDMGNSATNATNAANAAASVSASAAQIAINQRNIERFNAFDIWDGMLTRSNGTSHKVVYTWSGEVCTVTTPNGASDDHSVNTVLAASALPASVVPGETYYVRYTTTNDAVQLRIIFKNSGGSNILPAEYLAGDASVTVPTNAAQWVVQLYVAPGATFDPAVTVSNINFLSAKTNRDLETETANLSKKVALTFFDINNLSTFGVGDLPINSFTYHSLSGITFTDKPDGISSSAYVMIKREQMNSLGNLSLVTVYDAVNEITYRATYRSGDGHLFPWKKILTNDDMQIMSIPPTNTRTCNIFKRVLCVGDSYTEGFINLSDGAEHPDAAKGAYKDYSWPKYMENITGNEWVNCGVSGATSKTWMTNANGFAAAQAAGVVQAYIVQLMINDATTGTSYYLPVGTIEDVGDESPDTYYGCYSKLIREIHAISPDAYIFVCTCPYLGEKTAYQQAVRDIAELYAETYNVHLLDFKADQALFQNSSLTGDLINFHYTAIGYEQFAEIYAYYISNYINTHISAFQHVHQIPYDS